MKKIDVNYINSMLDEMHKEVDEIVLHTMKGIAKYECRKETDDRRTDKESSSSSSS